jgi:hypothetical protein
MAFFQALPIDVKVLLGAFVALALLHFFSHNQRMQKYYVVVLVLLAVGGVYRYQVTKPVEQTIAEEEPGPAPKTSSARTPLASTAGK